MKHPTAEVQDLAARKPNPRAAVCHADGVTRQNRYGDAMRKNEIPGAFAALQRVDRKLCRLLTVRIARISNHVVLSDVVRV